MVLLFKGLVGVGFQLLFFGVLMFAPIGNFNWPHAMDWLVIYGAMAFVSCVFLRFFVPRLWKRGCARAGKTNRALTGWRLVI